jgi:hypothetical protein
MFWKRNYILALCCNRRFPDISVRIDMDAVRNAVDMLACSIFMDIIYTKNSSLSDFSKLEDI